VDPRDEEADFWAAQRGQGLAAIEPKVLESTTPQPGVRSLVLRIEMTFRAQARRGNGCIGGAGVVSQDAAGAPGAGKKRGRWGLHILVTQRSDVVPLPHNPIAATQRTQYAFVCGSERRAQRACEALMAAKKDHKRVLVVFWRELVLRLPRAGRGAAVQGSGSAGDRQLPRDSYQHRRGQG